MRNETRRAETAERDRFDQVRLELERREQARTVAVEKDRREDREKDTSVDDEVARAREGAQRREVVRVAEEYVSPRPPRPPQEARAPPKTPSADIEELKAQLKAPMSSHAPMSSRPVLDGLFEQAASPAESPDESPPVSTRIDRVFESPESNHGLDMAELDAVLARARHVLDDDPRSP